MRSTQDLTPSKDPFGATCRVFDSMAARISAAASRAEITAYPLTLAVCALAALSARFDGRPVAGVSPPEFKMLVSTIPGQTTVTPTPGAAWANSAARPSDSATTACLDARYGAIPGITEIPAMEAVFTTWPLFCAMRCGTKARRPWMTPRRLTPRTQSHSESSISQVNPNATTPALLATTSTRPK